MINTVDMKFPMLALGNVSLAQAQYVRGDVFDALTDKSYRYLQKARAARPFRLGERTGSIAATETDEVRALRESIDALTPRQLLERFMTAEGTSDATRSGSARTVRRGF